MKNIRVIAAGIAAAGFISCTVTTHGTSQAAAEGDFAGRNAPYYYHAEGIKAHTVKGDMQAGIACFGRAIQADSSYAPAYYEIAEILLETDPQRAVAYSQTANALDTANLAYQNQLGRALVMSEKYDEAMGIYTRLMRDDPHNPLNYRLLAALYDYKGQPFTAIAILDTAEMRLGRLEELSTYKREILIRLRLYDKAVEEAKKLLHEARRGVLAVSGDDGYPYAVPINYLYDEDAQEIIFHGSKVGHKVDALKRSDKVCFTVYGDETVETDEAWAPFLKSAVVFGRCRLVADRGESDALCKKFAMKYYPTEKMVDDEVAASGKAVQMFRISIDHISGKKVQER